MRIDGNCFCGHIRYEAEIDPSMVVICHCTDCQTHSGTAFGVVVGIVNDEFHLLHGKLKTYEKIADSGNVRALAFCPQCGTRIYARTPGDASKFFGLRVGTVRQRDQLKPTRQAWCDSAQDWVQDISAIPRANDQR
ncbi:MAG: GFA family protein [Rhizobiales bacterium]|nr:GFA family protein [Hyphomicrobiales bacterium]